MKKDVENKITERQRETYKFIFEFMFKHGYSPSLKEIANGLYISKPVAKKHLDALIEKGYISIVPRTARSITIKKII